MKTLVTSLAFLLILITSGNADESAALEAGKKRLEECRKLFAAGKEDESMRLAEKSVSIFIAPFPELRGVGIGSIQSKKYYVIVYLNTGENERAKPKPPITRPYSFLVYSGGKPEKFLYALDYEHGHDDGKLVSAALGRMVKSSHRNYGMVDITADFSEVKKRAMEIIESGKAD